MNTKFLKLIFLTVHLKEEQLYSFISTQSLCENVRQILFQSR